MASAGAAEAERAARRRTTAKEGAGGRGPGAGGRCRPSGGLFSKKGPARRAVPSPGPRPLAPGPFISQVRSIKRPRKQLPQPNSLDITSEIRHGDLHVPAEFPQNLPAGAAGRRQVVGVGGYGDAPELSGAFGNRFENRNALGAHGQAVGGV